MAEKKIKVTLVKSLIGTKQDHRATAKGSACASSTVRPCWKTRPQCAA